MTDKQIKVGDVVAWADVPDAALVRERVMRHYALRMRGRGIYVGAPDEPWLSANPWSDDGRWHWTGADGGPATIIALNVPADASADDLRRLAEVFEVREALRVEPGLPGFTRVYLGDVMIGGFSGGDGLSHWAQRLHAAGWRPGMTAEDATRLLAASERGGA